MGRKNLEGINDDGITVQFKCYGPYVDDQLSLMPAMIYPLQGKKTINCTALHKTGDCYKKRDLKSWKKCPFLP